MAYSGQHETTNPIPNEITLNLTEADRDTSMPSVLGEPDHCLAVPRYHRSRKRTRKKIPDQLVESPSLSVSIERLEKSNMGKMLSSLRRSPGAISNIFCKQ